MKNKNSSRGKMSQAAGFSLMETLLAMFLMGILIFVLVDFIGRIHTYYRKYQVHNEIDTDARKLMSVLNGTLPLSNGKIAITCNTGGSINPPPPCSSIQFTTVNSPLLPGASVQYTIAWAAGNQVTMTANNLPGSPAVNFGPQVLANNVTVLTFLLPDSRNTNILEVTLMMNKGLDAGRPDDMAGSFMTRQRILLETHQ